MIVGISWGSMLVVINFAWPLVNDKVDNAKSLTQAAPLMIYTLCLNVDRTELRNQCHERADVRLEVRIAPCVRVARGGSQSIHCIGMLRNH